MSKNVCIGIDIGGTRTKYGFVDQGGNCHYNDYIYTREYETFEVFTNTLFSIIKKHIEKEGYDVKAMGVGAPNANYFSGIIDSAPNLPWKGVVNIKKEFKKQINVPMVLTNDANAAAVGEMLFGGASNMKNFIVITLGTGLGSGIVVDGNLVYGSTGFAGEIGHTIVIDNGRECGCGRKGCLETYASASGLKRTVRYFQSKKIIDSKLKNMTFDQISSKLIYQKARNGDELALKAFEYTGNILGEALANSVLYTSPEAIFLFGGVASAGNLILEPTKKAMEENLLNIFKGKVKLLLSSLKEVNASVMGTSALAWDNIKKQQKCVQELI